MYCAKRLLSLCLAICLCLAAGTVYAQKKTDVELSGRCGAYAYWHLNKDTLIIGGIGAVGSFGQSPADPYYTIDKKWDTPYAADGKLPWDAYRLNIKKLYIEEGITSLFDSDFNNYSNLEYIYIPASIRDLGYAAFRRSSNLRQLHYAGSKEALTISKDTADNLVNTQIRYNSYEDSGENTGFYARAEQAMQDTYATGSVGKNLRWVLEKRVLYIYGSGAMLPMGSDNTSYIDPVINHPYGEDGPLFLAPWGSMGEIIQQVVLDDGVESVFMNAFSECKNIETVYLPATLKKVELNAFAQAAKIQKVHYGGNASSWSNITFANEADKSVLMVTDFYFESLPDSVVRKDYSGSGNGWKWEDSKWYYLNEKGEKQTGWTEVNGFWWCLDEEGVWLSDKHNTPPPAPKAKRKR